MKTQFLALSLAVLCAQLQAGDTAAAIKKLEGEFDSANGAVTVKRNKTPDVAALAAVASDTTVKSLNLDGCTLKADGVAAIAGSKSLNTLLLEHTMVNKVPDLKELSKLSSLEELSLGGSNFGDEGLATLCTLTKLKSLKLGHVGRDDRNCFTAAGLKALVNLPKLEVLVLHLHKPIDDMIPVLAQLKTVRDFKIGGISSDYLKRLQAAMPNAKVAPRGPLTDAAK